MALIERCERTVDLEDVIEGEVVGGALVPTNLPVATASLPQLYERATRAIAECASIDECATWANKAQALASYAKQAKDETLVNHARRIQARALRRCGEMLREYDARGDHRKNNAAVVSSPSQGEAAKQAGLSQRQRETAVRVAAVPAGRFEAAVESDRPPTVTALAKEGKRERPKPPPLHCSQEEFQAAISWNGAFERFVAACREHDPERVARGLLDAFADKARRDAAFVEQWLEGLLTALEDKR